MRILIYGTSPLASTGYATVTRYLARGLRARGHEPAIFAWNSHVGPPAAAHGALVLPRGNRLYGDDLLGLYARNYRADVILTVCDPWILPPERWRYGHDVPVVHWFPCQSEPASRALVKVCAAADGALCYSRWGTEVMRRGGLDRCRYVPLGVYTTFYRPDGRGRDEARAFLGSTAEVGPLGDRYVVGCVAANASTVPSSRKGFEPLLRAFARFQRDARPDAVLYLHTLYNDDQGGINFLPILESLGLRVNRDVLFPDPLRYTLSEFDDRAMARIYRACDVMAQASAAEGFGLPVLEAQACGTPVITTAYSSMPELTAYGRAIEPAAHLWAPAPVEGWVAVPGERALLAALEDAAAGRLVAGSTPAEARQAGLDLANSLSWDRVLDDHLLPALSEILA